MKSYADSTYALLEAIDNQNGVELATLLDESLFAVPVYDEHRGHGVGKYPDQEDEQDPASQLAVCPLHPGDEGDWYWWIFQKDETGSPRPLARYNESYRTIFLPIGAELRDEAKGLVMSHELFHAYQHKLRDYQPNDERYTHWEEERDALEFETRLAAENSEQFSELLQKHTA